MKGCLVILSGPSGVGKDTLLDRWNAVNSRVVRVCAATTRDPRPGEVDGKDYFFLKPAEFKAQIDRGDFLEYKLVHGKHYGTPNSGVTALLDQGKIAILKIDVQGAIEVMQKRPYAISIFVQPPSEEELEARIRGRGTEAEESIQKRLKNALGEMLEAHRYAHQVVNDDVDAAVAKLEEIVRDC